MIGAQQRHAQDLVASTARSLESHRIAFAQTDASSKLGHVLSARAKESDTGSSLFAIDGRIDNRSELLDVLGHGRDPSIDDDALFFLAYQRWGSKFVDHVIGDFAGAAWNSHHKALVLFRDATGQRPLHYHLGADFVAFASMPQGLHELAGVRREADLARLAEFVADIPVRGPATFFRNILRVESANIVSITPRGTEARRYWNMPARELYYRNPDDYTEAFREQLDRATRVRLRGAGSVVAAQLSAGLDSGAVASTAARLLTSSGGRVLAITSAPRQDFHGPVPYGRIADEGPLAALLASKYDNMDHVILRSKGVSPLSLLSSDSRLFAQPIGYPCNNVWWRETSDAARSLGATVMLTGEMGNLTISAGGLSVLPDYLRAGNFVTWLREVIALEKGGPRWRGLMAASFAPWLPRGVLSALSSLSADGNAAAPNTLSAMAATTAQSRASRHGNSTFGKSDREARWDMVKVVDPGNFRKGALLRWGIDERDPTADRRLVEFCFSLPPRQLLGGGMTRRLARTALADRLPAAILNGPRGYQFADWYESLDKASLTRVARRIAASPVAAQVIDIDAMNRLIGQWPVGDWASARTVGIYRVGLLRALSAGIFALKAGQ